MTQAKGQSPKIRGVVFDLDGTLLDTAPDFVVVTNQLRAEEGLQPLDEIAIRAVVSNGARALVNLAFNLDEPDADYARLRQRLLDLYLQHIAVFTRPFPGIQSLLHTLADHGIRWGIATNKPALYTHALMESLRMQPPPTSVICPDDVTHRKPHPESLLLASQHFACEPNQLIFVGDHKRDIDCGRDAGAITIAAAYGYIESENDINTWQADYCVSHAQDIWPIVQQLI